MKKEISILGIILLLAAILRFYNLMHDSPYFFNPDERNMANAISQFKLPSHPPDLFRCLTSEFISPIFNSKFLISNEFPNFKFQISNCNLNPHFFAYGQFPLYLSFASDQLIKPVSNLFIKNPTTNDQSLTTNFPSAIFWLRFYSALSSTLTVLIVFLISRKLFTFHFSLFTAAAAAFTPGLIQSAHFGTTESLLTFFFLASVLLSLRIVNLPLSLRSRPGGRSNLYSKFAEIAAVALLPRNDIILLSISIGIATGSKLTGIFFLFPPFMNLMILIFRLFNKRRKLRVTSLLGYFVTLLLVIIGSISIFILSSPYNLVDLSDFKSAVFGYESDVAMGKYEAFYTRQFVNTTPILFQAEKVFPYALGWPVFILGTIGFITTVITLMIDLVKNFQFSIFNFQSKFKFKIFKFNKNFKFQISNYSKNKKQNGLQLLFIFIITASFLIYLLPNAFLFAKWTRFMTPILPFFAIFAGYFISQLFFFICHCERSEAIPSKNAEFLRDRHVPIKSGLAMTSLTYLFICLLVLIGSTVPGLAFMSIYTHEDSRATASKWIYNNIPNNSYILSETANVVDIPLGIPNKGTMRQWNSTKVISFDFYHMDENPMIFNDLLSHLSKADYIFIPSRRIFANYPKLPNKYPLTTKYYQLLFSGALGFEKVTEINSFPMLGPWQFPDENAEETFTVFDHPVVRIYKNVNDYNKDYYLKLFHGDYKDI